MRPQIESRGEYEEWLDELDRKLYVEKGVICAEFQQPLRFAFAEYRDVAGIKQCATRFRSFLRESEWDLPREYLIKRFLRLAIKRARIHTSVDFIMSQLRAEWHIRELSDF